MPGTSFSAANWSGYDEQSLSNPSSALTDFTLEIDVANLSASWKAAVQSDGGDIRLTKGDNTELPFDLVNWAYNAGAPTGTIYVKYSSTMATSGTQTVRVWAGYTPGTATAYSTGETFGQYNAYDSYTSIFAPYKKSQSASDRTGNNGATTVGVSLGSEGYNFDATDYINHGSNAVLDNVFTSAGGTVKVVFDADSTGGGGFGRVFDKSGGWLSFLENIASQNTLVFQKVFSTTTGRWEIDITLNTEQTVAIAYADGSTSNNPTIYLNGSSASVFERTSPAGSASSGASASLLVGNRTDFARAFDGDIKLVKISKGTIRSAAWEAQEYALENQASFWGTWAWTAATSTYDETISLTAGAAIANAGTFVASPSASLAAGAAIAQAGTFVGSPSLSLATAAELQHAGSNLVSATVAFAAAGGLSPATTLTADAAATLAVGAAIVQSANLIVEQALELAAGAEHDQSGGFVLAAEISLQASAAIAQTAEQTIDAALNLGLTASQAAAGSLVINEALTLAVVALLQQSATKNALQAKVIYLVLQQLRKATFSGETWSISKLAGQAIAKSGLANQTWLPGG